MRRLLLLIALVPVMACAQRTEDDYAGQPSNPPAQKERFRDRLVFGGGLGAAFGTVTFVQIAPQVGYRTTDRWINGVGLNYIYFSDMYGSQSIYGGSVWTRLFVFDGAFIGSEYEVLNLDAYDVQTSQWGRRNVPIWMVGGGYYSRGGGVGVGLQIMWDLIQDPLSPYGNPIIRGGVMVGF